MPSLGEMMAQDEPSPEEEAGEGDHEAMGAASMQAMWEAMKAGDFKAAYQHFCDMSEHEKGGGLALLIGKEKGKGDGY